MSWGLPVPPKRKVTVGNDVGTITVTCDPEHLRLIEAVGAVFLEALARVDNQPAGEAAELFRAFLVAGGINPEA